MFSHAESGAFQLAEKRPRALTNIECNAAPLAPPVHRLTNEEHERLLKRARDSPPEPVDSKRTKGEGESEKSMKDGKGTGWAKGTGYSSTERSLAVIGRRRQEGWNHKSYQEAQKQKDEEVRSRSDLRNTLPPPIADGKAPARHCRTNAR